MSSLECDQCALDIKTYFKSHAPDLVEDFPGAKSEDLQPLEKSVGMELPEAFTAMLNAMNGGFWYNEFRALSAVKIQGLYTKHIPFASDPDDNLLVINEKTYAVHEAEMDGDAVVLGDSLYDSFEKFLENYRNQLLSGALEYVEDVGMCEKVTAKKGK